MITKSINNGKYGQMICYVALHRYMTAAGCRISALPRQLCVLKLWVFLAVVVGEFV